MLLRRAIQHGRSGFDLYALPAERNAKLWAERIPDGFIFNIKPFALMTQHPAEVSRLPKQSRENSASGGAEQSPAYAAVEGSRRYGVPDVLERNGAAPWSRQAGDGGTFQFPPYFIPKAANLDYLARLPERLPGASIAIESSVTRIGFATKLDVPRP